MASITLDIVYDDTLEDAVRRLLEGEDGTTLDSISLIITDDTYAPGGGWPLVQFIGTMKEIVQLIGRYCGGDLEQALFLCEAIE